MLLAIRSGELKADLVELMACRPISALKRWRLVRIVRASRGRVRGERDVPVPGLESEEPAK